MCVQNGALHLPPSNTSVLPQKNICSSRNLEVVPNTSLYLPPAPLSRSHVPFSFLNLSLSPIQGS